MINFTAKLKGNLSHLSERSSNIVRHLGWSIFLKAGSVLANLMLVPLTLNYLGEQQYGVWLTLSSFIAWFSLFDIGLGNGLRNKFAEANAKGDLTAVKAYVSTAYFSIAFISGLLFSIFIIANVFINWTSVFNSDARLQHELVILMPFVFGFFCIQLCAKLIVSIYQANQHHSIGDKVQFFTQIISLLLIWLLLKQEDSSILWFGVAFSSIPPLVLLFINIFGFSSEFKEFKPNIRAISKECFSDITSLGFKFFVIQMAVLILFSTDNVIIAQLFGPEEVVPYSIAFKYFSILTMAYSILVAPFWSSFTDAYAKNDIDWIRTAVSKIQRIWLFCIPLTLCLMLALSNWFYTFWVGEKIEIPTGLSLGMALFVAMGTFNQVYTSFINGVGLIKLQLVTAILTIIINIPLSIFLAMYMGLGVEGVIYATCISLSYGVLLRPMQYYKVVNNRAHGIWAE